MEGKARKNMRGEWSATSYRIAASSFQATNIETLLYGCKKGDPDYMEEILYQCKGYVNREELMQKGKEWADKNNYDRLRISVVNLSTPPRFDKTINPLKPRR